LPRTSPSLRALLPDLRGKRVLDLGCGYGWFCRFACDVGATYVPGLDVSHKMLARAIELTPEELRGGRIASSSLDRSRERDACLAPASSWTVCPRPRSEVHARRCGPLNSSANAAAAVAVRTGPGQPM
jgi:SAM-dependent methyltransferase